MTYHITPQSKTSIPYNISPNKSATANGQRLSKFGGTNRQIGHRKGVHRLSEPALPQDDRTLPDYPHSARPPSRMQPVLLPSGRNNQHPLDQVAEIPSGQPGSSCQEKVRRGQIRKLSPFGPDSAEREVGKGSGGAGGQTDPAVPPERLGQMLQQCLQFVKIGRRIETPAKSSLPQQPTHLQLLSPELPRAAATERELRRDPECNRVSVWEVDE